MKIKLELRTDKMAGEIVLEEIKIFIESFGYKEKKDYTIEAYQTLAKAGK